MNTCYVGCNKLKNKHKFRINAISTLIFFITVFSPFSFAEQPVDNAVYEKALQAYAQGENTTAIIHVKNLLSQSRENLSARLLFAKILLEEGELAAAEDQYMRALALNADTSLVILPLAKSLLLQSKNEEIIERIIPGDYGDNMNALIHVYRAKAYSALQDIAQAKYHYELVLALQPDQLDAILGLASLAVKENKLEEVQNYIDQAKTIAPNSSYVWFYEGESYRRLEDKKHALDAFNKALSFNENYASALRSRASIYLDSNQLELAKADIDKLLTQQNDDPLAELLKAFYLARTNDIQGAKRLLASTSTRLNRVDPELIEQFPPLLMISGLTQYLTGDFQAAKVNLSQYLNQDPSNKQAREVLAEIALIRNQPSVVIKLLSEIENQFLTQRSAELLIDALMQEEQYEEAITRLTHLSNHIKKTKRLNDIHAVLLIKLGKAQEAITLLSHSENKQDDDVSGSHNTALILGYNYLQLTQYQDALVIAEGLASKNILSVVELNFIATVHLALKQYEQAELVLRKAQKESPQDMIVLQNLSQLLIKTGRLAEADNILSEILKRQANNVNVLPIYGELLQQQQKLAEATTVFEQLDKLQPHNLSTKYTLANLYLLQGKNEQAIDIANEINRIEPLSSTAIVVKVKAWLAQKEYSKASRRLKFLFELFNDNPQKLAEIAQFQLSAQDFEAAQKTIVKIKTINSKHPEINLLQARLFNLSKQSEKAIALLMSQQNKTADIHYALATSYLQNKEAAKALEHARIAYQKVNDIKHHNLLVKIFWQLDLYQACFDQLEQWLKAHPNDWKVVRMYASLLEQQGENHQAIKQYQRVLTLAPNDIFSLNNLALTHLILGENSQALVLVKQAFDLAPLDSKVNDSYGWILVQNQQYQQGLQHLRDSYSRDTQNATTMYHIGFTLAKLNRKQESLQELNKALTKAETSNLKELINTAIQDITSL